MLHPWFSFSHNALSDLGAPDTLHHEIYNVGMIAIGLAGLFFAWGVPTLANGRLGLAGTLVLVCGFISLILVGLFPEGTSLHGSVSIGFFALTTFGILIFGLDQLLKRGTRTWGVLVLALVALGLVAVKLVETIPHLGAAIPETIGAFAFSEFSILFSARLLNLLQ